MVVDGELPGVGSDGGGQGVGVSSGGAEAWETPWMTLFERIFHPKRPMIA